MTHGSPNPSSTVLAALQLVERGSPQQVVAADAEGRIVWSNRDGTPVGAPLEAAFPAAAADVRRAWQQCLSHGNARLEWGESGSAGVRAWFVTTLAALREEGRVTFVVARSTDVTALKQSEERLRRSEELMVDTQGVAHLGTWEWDVAKPTATWSAELYRIYGLTPEQYTPSYEGYLKMVHPEDRQRVMDATTRVYAEHVPYSHDERIFRPDGSIRYLHTWAHPVLDENGKLVRLVGVCQDITDRKMAELQLQELNRDLETRVRERTRELENAVNDREAFQAILAHDLKAPLTTIELAAALLELDLKSGAGTAPERIKRIRSATRRMNELMNDLLTLSRVTDGEFRRAPVDLSAIASEVAANLQRGEPSRSAEFRIDAGLSCTGDAGLLRAALENLIGNAWKYSAKVPHAVIEFGRSSDSGRPFFFIRDNGAGFDMSQAHRLFAPFQRLHDARDFDGTGIGLAAVQRIIARHGGTIRAEAAPGRGATFSFDLPPA